MVERGEDEGREIGQKPTLLRCETKKLSKFWWKFYLHKVHGKNMHKFKPNFAPKITAENYDTFLSESVVEQFLILYL